MLCLKGGGQGVATIRGRGRLWGVEISAEVEMRESREDIR